MVFLQRAWEFIQENPAVWFAGALASILLAGISIALVPWGLRRLPANHFIGPVAPGAADRHLWVVILRNLGGWLLVLSGIAMLVLPGQGILTLIIGLVLVDFPGKRRVEQALVRRATVRRGLDWIRARGGLEPFEVPGKTRDPDLEP